jgi:hypothetical protein
MTLVPPGAQLGESFLKARHVINAQPRLTCPLPLLVLIPVNLLLRIGEGEPVHPINSTLHNLPGVLPLFDPPPTELLHPMLLETSLHLKHLVHHYSLLLPEVYELGLLEYLLPAITLGRSRLLYQ